MDAYFSHTMSNCKGGDRNGMIPGKAAVASLFLFQFELQFAHSKFMVLGNNWSKDGSERCDISGNSIKLAYQYL